MFGVLSALLVLTPPLAAHPAAAAAPAPATDGGAPRVSAHVAAAEVSVGESFVVELRASGPPGTEWTFPEDAGSEEVELVTAPPATPSPGAAASPAPVPSPGSASWRYRAAVFAVKDAAVPPVSVRYRLPDGTEGATESAAVPLRLRSLLPKDPQEQTLADVRPPVPLPIGWPFWAGLALLVLLLAALVFGVLRRRRPRAQAAAAAPPTPADVEARAALDALAASGRIERGEYRTFYIALAEIAKRYLERRLEAPVLEMTSTEALLFLRGHRHGEVLVSTMRDLMSAADQVKFARGAGQAEEARRHVEAVRTLVATLEARLAAPPAGAEAPPNARVEPAGGAR